MTRLACIVLCVACGGKTPGASRVVDAEEDNLADCTPLGRVKGSASESASDPATAAKNDARAKAAELGATSIRWLVPCCTTVEGDAYKCDVPKE